MHIRDEINRWIRSINPEGYDIYYRKAYRKIKAELMDFHACPRIDILSKSVQLLIVTYNIDYKQIYVNMHRKETT